MFHFLFFFLIRHLLMVLVVDGVIVRFIVATDPPLGYCHRVCSDWHYIWFTMQLRLICLLLIVVLSSSTASSGFIGSRSLLTVLAQHDQLHKLVKDEKGGQNEGDMQNGDDYMYRTSNKNALFTPSRTTWVWNRIGGSRVKRKLNGGYISFLVNSIIIFQTSRLIAHCQTSSTKISAFRGVRQPSLHSEIVSQTLCILKLYPNSSSRP